MKLALNTAIASALALATAAPVAAQPYGTPYRPTDQYMQQQREYQDQQDRYQDQQAQYRDQRAAYRAARDAYEHRLADWQARRADYDARHGAGAYARAYGPEPVWSDSNWAYYAPPGYYASAPPPPAGYYAPEAGSYGAPAGYTAPASCNNNAAVTAGIIGALAGGVLGNQVHHGSGTVLGALVGGGAGAAIGHASDVQKCDSHGVYYSYNDTMPYRVSNDVYRDNRYAYYQQRGCRLAPAPVNTDEYRYVRVCPDADGRYRVTG